MNLYRTTSKEAPPFLASKWLHLDLLVDESEMRDLLQSLQPCLLFSSLGVQPIGKNVLDTEKFLEIWQRYVRTLQSGNIPQDADFRFFFTAMMTRDTGCVRAIDIQEDKEIIIPYEPIVQMQLHRFMYSQTDGKFRSMIFGKQSVSWGVRFSYPQLFQYPHTRTVEEALNPERFINAAIFSSIRQWIRDRTMPTPFIVDGSRINVPIRIGKECLPWINKHPELIERNIRVYTV